MATPAEDPPPPSGNDPTPEGDPFAPVVAQICGGLAHTFSNQLTVLRGNLHLLSVEEPVVASAELSQLVASIRSAADEFALTVRGLALVAGSATPTARLIDMNALVRRQAERIAAFLGRRIEVRVVLANGLPPVAVDPTDLETALQELVYNARQAIAGHGALAFTTRMCRMEADGGGEGPVQVCLDIADSGRGMSADELVAAQRLLYSGGQHRRTAGLGLTVVRRAVEGAGGTVHLASTPGEGTTVTLALPAAEAPADAG